MKVLSSVTFLWLLILSLMLGSKVNAQGPAAMSPFQMYKIKNGNRNTGTPATSRSQIYKPNREFGAGEADVDKEIAKNGGKKIIGGGAGKPGKKKKFFGGIPKAGTAGGNAARMIRRDRRERKD